mmetsp:Transcript_21291/g.44574  ORF Transcript_21291/g.44574 Transcript_21291/m.44574 type:complete len:849 (-) Transcript_21291:210-2756(-)
MEPRRSRIDRSQNSHNASLAQTTSKKLMTPAEIAAAFRAAAAAASGRKFDSSSSSVSGNSSNNSLSGGASVDTASVGSRSTCYGEDEEYFADNRGKRVDRDDASGEDASLIVDFPSVPRRLVRLGSSRSSDGSSSSGSSGGGRLSRASSKRGLTKSDRDAGNSSRGRGFGFGLGVGSSRSRSSSRDFRDPSVDARNPTCKKKSLPPSSCTTMTPTAGAGKSSLSKRPSSSKREKRGSATSTATETTAGLTTESQLSSSFTTAASSSVSASSGSGAGSSASVAGSASGGNSVASVARAALMAIGPQGQMLQGYGTIKEDESGSNSSSSSSSRQSKQPSSASPPLSSRKQLSSPSPQQEPQPLQQQQQPDNLSLSPSSSEAITKKSNLKKTSSVNSRKTASKASGSASTSSSSASGRPKQFHCNTNISNSNKSVRFSPSAKLHQWLIHDEIDHLLLTHPDLSHLNLHHDDEGNICDGNNRILTLQDLEELHQVGLLDGLAEVFRQLELSGGPYNSWYTKAEYKVFRRQTKYDVAMVRHRAELRRLRMERDEVAANRTGRSNEVAAALSSVGLGFGEADLDSSIRDREDDNDQSSLPPPLDLDQLGEEEEEDFLIGIEHLVCPQTLTKIMQLRELHKMAVLEEYERLSHMMKRNYYLRCKEQQEMDETDDRNTGSFNGSSTSSRNQVQYISAAADPRCQQALRSMSKKYSKYSKVRAWRYAGNDGLPPGRKSGNSEDNRRNEGNSSQKKSRKSLRDQEASSSDYSRSTPSDDQDIVEVEAEADELTTSVQESLQAVAIAASLKDVESEENINRVASFYKSTEAQRAVIGNAKERGRDLEHKKKALRNPPAA